MKPKLTVSAESYARFKDWSLQVELAGEPPPGTMRCLGGTVPVEGGLRATLDRMRVWLQLPARHFKLLHRRLDDSQAAGQTTPELAGEIVSWFYENCEVRRLRPTPAQWERLNRWLDMLRYYPEPLDPSRGYFCGLLTTYESPADFENDRDGIIDLMEELTGIPRVFIEELDYDMYFLICQGCSRGCLVETLEGWIDSNCEVSK